MPLSLKELEAARHKFYSTGLRLLGLTHTTPEAESLEAQGWRVWLKTLAPDSFTAPFSDDHIEFWDLFWSILIRRRNGEDIPEQERDMILPLGRGNAKSTSAEMAAIAEGALLGGYSSDGQSRRSCLCLYVSDTQTLAEEHLFSVKAILESRYFQRYYPSMSRPKVSQAGGSAKYTQNMIICENGWAMTARGITASVRGGRVGTSRFTFVVMDDIDNLNDSLMVIEKKKRIIARTVLPAMSKDGITLLAQNLITENSVASQIVNRKTDLLSNRTIIGGGPVKAFTELELESETLETGQVRWNIKHCVPTWEYFNVADAKAFLARSGKEAFLAEYQHEFDSRQGKVISAFDRDAQVISWSMFEKVFGTRYIPQHWRASCGLDIGYSDGMHPHYSAWAFIAVAAMNSPLAGKHFVYRTRMFTRVELGDQANIIKNDLARNEVRPFAEYPGLVSEWQMSHERTGEMLTLNQKYGLPFSKFKHWGKTDGIAQWNHLSRADNSQPHPFLEDEYDENAKEWLYGCPSLFYVVDDDQLHTPRDDAGMKIALEQISGWEYVPTKVIGTGLTIEQPSKINDDLCDAIRAQLEWFGQNPTPLTQAEEYIRKLQARLPSHVPIEPDKTLTGDAATAAAITRQMAAARLNQDLRKEGVFIPRHPGETEPEYQTASDYDYEPEDDQGGW